MRLCSINSDARRSGTQSQHTPEERAGRTGGDVRRPLAVHVDAAPGARRALRLGLRLHLLALEVLRCNTSYISPLAIECPLLNVNLSVHLPEHILTALFLLIIIMLLYIIILYVCNLIIVERLDRFHLCISVDISNKILI